MTFCATTKRSANAAGAARRTAERSTSITSIHAGRIRNSPSPMPTCKCCAASATRAKEIATAPTGASASGTRPHHGSLTYHPARSAKRPCSSDPARVGPSGVARVSPIVEARARQNPTQLPPARCAKALARRASDPLAVAEARAADPVAREPSKPRPAAIGSCESPARALRQSCAVTSPDDKR